MPGIQVVLSNRIWAGNNDRKHGVWELRSNIKTGAASLVSLRVPSPCLGAEHEAGTAPCLFSGDFCQLCLYPISTITPNYAIRANL